MNCFHHEDHVAVANCRRCSKGLCKDCSCFDEEYGIFCSDGCFEKLKQIDHLNSIAIEAYKRNQSVFLNAGKLYWLTALFMIALGFLLFNSGWQEGWASDLYKMGTVMMVFGISLLIMSFRKTKK